MLNLTTGLKRRLAFGCMLLAGLVTACEIEEQKALKGWTPAYSGPLAKGRVSAGSVIGQQVIGFGHTFHPASWLDNLEPKESGLAPIKGAVGPLNLFSTPFWDKLDLDQAELRLKLANHLPVPVLAGTELVLKNSREKRIIWRNPLQNNLPPGDTLTLALPPFPKLDLKDQSHAFLLKPLTLGTETPIASDAWQDATLGFSLEIAHVGLDLALVSKPSAIGFQSSSSLAWRPGKLANLPVSGTFNFAVNNHFPLRLKMQAYLMTPSNQIRDSLFQSPALVKPAKLDGKGLAIAPTKSQFKIALQKPLAQALADAERLKLNFTAVAQGTNQAVRLQGSDFLSFDLRGQFRVKP